MRSANPVGEVDQDGVEDGAAPRGFVVLTLDQIQAAEDIVTEWMAVPEWAPKDAKDPKQYGVFVRSMTGRERARWQQESVIGAGKNTQINFLKTTVNMVVITTVDDTGKRIFSDATAAALQKKNSAILERIAEVAMRLSGIGEDEMKTISGNSMGSLDDSETTS